MVSKYGSLFGALDARDDIRDGEDLSNFSENQRVAITAPIAESRVVIAGPGAGKTTVMVARVVHLLRHGVRPEDLLITTFTRAAADELQKRIALKWAGGRLPFLGTVHGLSFRMLGGQEWLLKAGLRLASDEELEAVVIAATQTAAPSLLEDEMTARELLLRVQRAQEGATETEAIQAVTAEFTRLLQEAGLAGFVNLLTAQMASRKRKDFRFILVDEAQDLTPLQLQWIAAHSNDKTARFLVGDDDQAIYAFRGSGTAVLAEQVASGIPVVQLAENWRCALDIVDRSHALIALNSNRVAVKQVPQNRGGSAMVFRCKDETAELHEIAITKVPPMIICRTRAEVDHFKNYNLDAVTMHESKGQEWDYVWVSGLESGAVPHVMGEDEEERRLLYVAMTRAKKRLVLCVRDRVRGKNRKVSPFVGEAGFGSNAG